MALRIALILGSTRPGRRGDQIAAWALDTARAHGGADYELVDLADHDLGNLDEPGNPNLQQYQHEHTRAWGALVDSFDGYVFLVPEYNHSYPGALKNALDHVYREWNDKAAGIISYGGWVAGARAAEALRLVLAELQVATVRAQPTISTHPSFRTGTFVPQQGLDAAVRGMLDQVVAWSGALREVRDAKRRTPEAA
ncbi:NADPH-dependent FMN reductase [Streptomyces beihaiensis]|uniref:NAD(P)H-dependent oxidoreductase n=1 Tax=Streptomyces beihaiensis TaxID=2984495 RepID=A0ABT3TVP6_9ACTN|nr:NAD(P)H-dependent oxidoreductase [Streptomyces beihaiensis]MCX3061127.1 NAD(P)H-dependent oxidoreductase [Streptomyces beihaiensis]